MRSSTCSGIRIASSHRVTTRSRRGRRTIVDNAIRRQLRRRQSGPSIALSPTEVLAQQADARTAEPDHAAVEHEESKATARAFSVLLACYLAAFETLSDRERFVLQMVEVERMRYRRSSAS